MGGGSDYLDSPTPKTVEKRLKQGYECTDWYFYKVVVGLESTVC